MTRRGRAAVPALALSALALVGPGCSDRYLYPISRDASTGTVDAPGVDATGTVDASAEPKADLPDVPDVPPGPCTSQVEGYANQGDGTMGGGNGPRVFPTTQAELQMYADTEGSLVIRIDRLITVTGQVDFNTNDKTVEGIGAASGISGGGLRVKEAGNIILRNLVFQRPIGTDAITLETANHIWIDHCDLSSDRTSPIDTYDSLIDITHGSTFITISWTSFRDHNDDVSFMGNSDNTGVEDVAIRVTLHHNFFNRTRSANPSLRFGVLDAYNNHYLAVDMVGIASRMGGKVLAEANYFDGVPVAIATRSESPTDGFVESVANHFVNGPAPTGLQTTTIPRDYERSIDPVLQVPVQVGACVGTGKLGL